MILIANLILLQQHTTSNPNTPSILQHTIAIIVIYFLLFVRSFPKISIDESLLSQQYIPIIPIITKKNNKHAVIMMPAK